MTLRKSPLSTSTSHGSRGQLRVVAPRSCSLPRVLWKGWDSRQHLPARVTPKCEQRAAFACLSLQAGGSPGFAILFLSSYHLIPLLQAKIMSLTESQVSCTSQVWTMAVLSILPNVQIIPLFCPEGEQIPTFNSYISAALNFIRMD